MYWAHKNKIYSPVISSTFISLLLSYNGAMVCSAQDRISFRRIVLKSAYKKRKMYEEFINSVPLLKSLEVSSAGLSGSAPTPPHPPPHKLCILTKISRSKLRWSQVARFGYIAAFLTWIMISYLWRTLVWHCNMLSVLVNIYILCIEIIIFFSYQGITLNFRCMKGWKYAMP